MLVQFTGIPLTEKAKEMQRGFAAVMLRVRGYVDEGGDAGLTQIPVEDRPHLSEKEIVEDIGRVGVDATFSEPPIAAYLDGRYLLRIHVIPSTAANKNGRQAYQISLSVPPGNGGRFGPVTLVWPGQSVVCVEPLCIKRSTLVRDLGLVETQTSPEKILLARCVPARPLEMHVAGHELGPEQWTWDERTGTLVAKVPEHVNAGNVLVVTRDSVMQSRPFSFE